MKIKQRVVSMLLAAVMLFSIIPLTALTSLASGSSGTDAMTEIESAFASQKLGSTIEVENDGYIGIPLEVSVYYGGGTVKAGASHSATPIVIYVVNTNIERIGTDSDTKIITSMLERGYIVVVFDYLNNVKAVSPALDWSVQNVRAKVADGTYFKNLSGFPSDKYYNNMVVPAGYNIEFDHIFWEVDKHGADGTFEKIVEVWNNDFRSYKSERLVKWVDQNGNRKATQKGHDGTEPVWLDINGNAKADGEYVRVKHTKAEKIEDCVQADGTPVDLNLYMHITYPTSPGYDVPVMTLSNSSGHLAKGTQTADRPQFSGFLFNGYAAVAFDYGYTPMARDDHYGYFDGSSGDPLSVTGDNVTYSIHWYNESKIDTAAMRYIRYLSAKDHAKYTFKDTAIGVYGNSKGGWATLLGEEHPEDLPERRIAPGFSGKSRYEAGKTVKSGVIDGGEAQPWLTYGGKTLDSGADFVYSSCGGGSEQITASHCPTYISCNLGDGSYYSSSNQFVNVCRAMDVPAMWFEVDQGHTFASAPDRKYGVNTYNALFTFANYYLRGDAVQVVYVARDAEYSGMPSNAPITVKFSGAVSKSEVEKITVKDSGGNSVNGSWISQFGDTEWTFKSSTLKGDTEYRLTVPSGIKGDNGKGMASDHIYVFRTGYEKAVEISSVKRNDGTCYYFTVPSDTKVFDKAIDVYTIRVTVTNDAVNKLEIYPLTSFNSSSPDSATVGAKLGSVAVNGSGQYDIDVSEYLSGMTAGQGAAFLVKQVKSAANAVNHKAPLNAAIDGVSISNTVKYSYTAAPGGKTALKITGVNEGTKYPNNYFYTNPTTVLSDSKVGKGATLTADDIGREFKISFSIYDTSSRIVTVRLKTLSNSGKKFADYNATFINVYTKANEWTKVEFYYTVYEPMHYDAVNSVAQSLSIITTHHGAETSEFYLSDIESTEIITDVTLGGGELLLSTTQQRVDPLVTEYGTIPSAYGSVEDYPYALFDKNGSFVTAGSLLISQNGTSGVLSSMQSSTDITSFPKNDLILVVRRDVTFDTVYDNFSFLFGNLLIDLRGNTFTCSGNLFNTYAKRCGVLNVTVKNGTVLQKSNSLITYGGTIHANYPYEEYGIREFNFTFSNVIFGYAEGASAVPFITRHATSNGPVKGNVLFDNCTFDLTKNAPSGEYKLLNADTDSKGNVETVIKVKGGVIKANSLSGITIGTASADNIFEFVKTADGTYTTAELPASADAPRGTYAADGKSVTFKADKTVGNKTVYALDIDPLWTPYGNIPSQYASLTDYPFVSFLDNGDGTYTFRKAEANIFADGSALMSDARDIKAIIYMRRDYTSSVQFNNMGFCKDNTFDLGGNTLTHTAGIPAQCKKEWDKKITYKNGTIVVDDGAFFSFTGAASGSGYKYILTLDSITFKRADGAVVTNPIYKFSDTTNAHGAEITFNNCIFDMRGEMPGNGITLFTAGDSKAGFTATVKVNGGNIICDAADAFTLIGKIYGNSSIVFGKYEGSYTQIKLPSAATPDFKVNTAEGEMYYGVSAYEDDHDVYTLFTKSAITTPYGEIPYKYASKELYPFVQFKVTGSDSYSFMEAANEIFTDANSLMYKARSQTTVIYMRRDYAKTDESTQTNLCHINGTLTIDFGGNTLTVEKGAAYSANVKKNVIISNIVFKNGTVIMKTGPFMNFASTFDTDAEGKHTFNIIFDGITFKYASGATSKYLTVSQYNNGLRAYFGNVTYNGCTFDLANAPSNVILFESGSLDGKLSGSTVVNGGRIINASMSNVDIVKSNNTDATVKFGKYSSKYLEITNFTGNIEDEELDSVEGDKLVFSSSGVLEKKQEASCEHTNVGSWQNDGTYHWKKCADCTEDVSKAKCSGGEATCTEKAVCSTCNKAYGSVNASNHSPSTNWTTENEKHYKVCTNGCTEKLDEASCSGGEATCKDKAVCSTCNTAYGALSSAHSYDGDCDADCNTCGATRTVTHTYGNAWKNDAQKHWHECNCGAKSGEEVHADTDSDGNCDACGYKTSSTLPTPTPDDGEEEPDEGGIGGGVIAVIVIASVAVLGVAGFAVFKVLGKKK